MADMDADGDMDLLVGDAEGYITYYSRDEEGNLSNEGHISADDEEVMVWRAAPHITDWDLDGDLDLLVGMFRGNITLIENTGSDEEFEFINRGLLQADGEDIWVGADSSPAFADLDGDGKRDLVLGSTWGDIVFYTNTGENDAPEFESPSSIADEEDNICLDGYTRIELVDWDRDGDLDLLTGLIHPELQLFINPSENDAPPIVNDHPKSFLIINSYPEPFNSTVNITFRSSRVSIGRLDLFNLEGRRLWSQQIIDINAGQNSISLNCKGYPADKYIVRLKLPEGSSSSTITLVK